MTQAHIFYDGSVQGVGFRYTAHAIATDLGLKGWVRNLADGRVEIIAEGDEGQIEQFCERVENHFGDYISGREVTKKDSDGKFDQFSIAYF